MWLIKLENCPNHEYLILNSNNYLYFFVPHAHDRFDIQPSVALFFSLSILWMLQFFWIWTKNFVLSTIQVASPPPPGCSFCCQLRGIWGETGEDETGCPLVGGAHLGARHWWCPLPTVGPPAHYACTRGDNLGWPGGSMCSLSRGSRSNTADKMSDAKEEVGIWLQRQLGHQVSLTWHHEVDIISLTRVDARWPNNEHGAQLRPWVWVNCNATVQYLRN